MYKTYQIHLHTFLAQQFSISPQKSPIIIFVVYFFSKSIDKWCQLSYTCFNVSVIVIIFWRSINVSRSYFIDEVIRCYINKYALPCIISGVNVS